MARKPIAADIQTRVLSECRRRCCICFGLDRDTTLKSGQIAHLDRNRDNNTVENLAYLCLDHHDQYDSRTSQSKGLTIGEVKLFRQELVQSLRSTFDQPVHFGSLRTPAKDPYAGQYIRIDTGNASADISLIPLPDSAEGQIRYFVTGMAFFGTDREYGPNMGSLDFEGIMEKPGELRFLRNGLRGGPALTILNLDGSGNLKILEENIEGLYGFRVSFAGNYALTGERH